MFFVYFIFVWVVCGIFAYGVTLNSFTTVFPYMNSICISVFMGMCGFFGLIISICFGFKSLGLRFIPLSREKRYEMFAREISLGREYFDNKY